jgi:hypothetical protein
LHVRLPESRPPSGDLFNGTYVPVEEPSTASMADMCFLVCEAYSVIGGSFARGLKARGQARKDISAPM